MNESSITVSVVYSPSPRVVHEVALSLPDGSAVRQAILASGLLAGLSEAELAMLECGVWGRKVSLGHGLRDGDRVELYRSLKVDPKEARRLRFAGQGTRAAGLFRRRRPGAKPGY
ncbi:RnfH family protein [Curvibacter sp. APW13]|uniref:RnfH family protein n=1 Tax=Curvibacter sp. APW13 TaxID=3077236 RepID=UPI0039656877